MKSSTAENERKAKEPRKVFQGRRKYFDNGTATGRASVMFARWKRFSEEVVAIHYPEVFRELKATTFPRYRSLRKRLAKLSALKIHDTLTDQLGSGPPNFRSWPVSAQRDARAVMAAIDEWSRRYNLRCAEKTWQERYDAPGETFDRDWPTHIALTNLSLWNTNEDHPVYVPGFRAQSVGFAKGKFHHLTFEVDHYIEDPLALSKEDLVTNLKQAAIARIEALAPRWLAERDKAAVAAGFVPTKHDETNGLPAAADLRRLAKYRIEKLSLKQIAECAVTEKDTEFWKIDPGAAEDRIRQRNSKITKQLGLVVRLTKRPRPSREEVLRGP